MKKKINLVLCFLFSLIVIYYSINNWLFLSFILVLLLPFLLKKGDSTITTIYLIYSFLAIFLGGYLKLYQKLNNYDTLIHTLWGFISCYIGLALLIIFKKDRNIYFNIIVMISICMMLSVFWEFIEFGWDLFFKTDMQRKLTGVYDTMKDLFVALIGSIIFCVWYIFERRLFINPFINEIYCLINKKCVKI